MRKPPSAKWDQVRRVVNDYYQGRTAADLVRRAFRPGDTIDSVAERETDFLIEDFGLDRGWPSFMERHDISRHDLLLQQRDFWRKMFEKAEAYNIPGGQS